ncbi:hypothetical protein EH223_08475 [candidate division KSB1 bacterium]|nr:MAG: hypothetical protein EH223_08475 [candidate division KSB1 bacterium]
MIPRGGKGFWLPPGGVSRLLVRSENTVQQSIANDGAYHTVIFQTETLDVLGEYDPATGIYTAQNDGVYIVAYRIGSQNINLANTYWRTLISINDMNTAGNCFMYIADTLNQVYAVSQSGKSGGCATVPLVVGDNVRIKAANNYNSARFTKGTKQLGYFDIARLI